LALALAAVALLSATVSRLTSWLPTNRATQWSRVHLLSLSRRSQYLREQKLYATNRACNFCSFLQKALRISDGLGRSKGRP
jgi:hypothetical protein